MSQHDLQRELPLTVRKGENEWYEIRLGDQDLSGVLPAVGGLTIEFEDNGEWCNPNQPTVTLKFAPGAINVDLDVDLMAMAEAIIAASQPDQSDAATGAESEAGA